MYRLKTFVILLMFVLLATISYANGLYPLKGISILLDPGHGGADPGAVGPTGLKESETNLRVAKYLKSLLEADGAIVSMTRTTDVYVSLGGRVKLAEKQKPDLFVSIHHNASLNPVTRNVSQIYYDAKDKGLSQQIGKKMITELAAKGFGEESMIIPGGFFVLRNNTAPAILTEGSYMTIPHIEQKLKTGKMLTNQAQALRLAIRKAFAKGPLKIKLLSSESPAKIDTAFFNFLFTSNKLIKRINVRNMPKCESRISFKRLPAFGNIYSLYNTKPLVSGRYDIELTFYAKDGTVAPIIRLPVEVNLPLVNNSLQPVAPFIPTGFRGKFPIRIILKDNDNNLNKRSAKVELQYLNKTITGFTSKSGISTMYLDLTGNEKHSVEIKLINDKKVLATRVLQIRNPSETFLLGKLETPSGEPIVNTKISLGVKDTINSGPDGYFYCKYPSVYKNINLQIYPPLGFEKQTFWVRTSGEPVVLPVIVLQPISKFLMGKTIAIIAPMSFDNLLRKFVKELMLAGAQVVRCHLPETMDHPEYQATLQANLTKNLDMIISFKRSMGGNITFHHYHRGGRGKRFSDAVKFSLLREKPAIKLKVQPGSDYEINHSGATAVVVNFPQQLPPDYPIKIILHMSQVLKTGF